SPYMSYLFYFHPRPPPCICTFSLHDALPILFLVFLRLGRVCETCQGNCRQRSTWIRKRSIGLKKESTFWLNTMTKPSWCIRLEDAPFGNSEMSNRHTTHK